MLETVQREITAKLWQHYCQFAPEMQALCVYLEKNHSQPVVLDHLALIDLPGQHSGIPTLTQVFQRLGYTPRGTGYLPEKQNDFLWLAPIGIETQLATAALPQIVVADFRLAELPGTVKAIITKYAALATPPPFDLIERLIEQLQAGHEVTSQLTTCIARYLTTRSWPLPTADEFQTVHAFNELLAWVLLFGHQPNHFAIAVHHCPAFASLAHFQSRLETDCPIVLNEEGGKIKGSQEHGIEQGSTCGVKREVMLQGGGVILPAGFAEFVWRHPRTSLSKPPRAWSDYFTGFIASQANYVIESLYLPQKEGTLSKV
jgi:hypothetical protein